MPLKGAPSNSALDRPSGGRGSGGGDLWDTHPTWTRKREGKAAWWESTERSEGVECVAVQVPRDMVKTTLSET